MKFHRLFMIVLVAGLLLQPAGATAGRPKPLTGAFDPEDVLVNLEERIAERDHIRYGDFLAPEFRFTPYAGVRLEYPSVDWDAWDRKMELRFVEELVSPSYRATLSLRDNVLEKGIESHGRAEWDLVYTLVSRGETFQSRATMVFVEVDNLWYLLEWIDTTVETDEESGTDVVTSGSLRGALIR